MDTNVTAETVHSTAPAPAPVPEQPAPKKFNRDAIRSAVLDSKSDDEVVTVFGVRIEIRAPDLEGIQEFRGMEEDNRAIAKGLIALCYVPETDEKVFDEADVEALMKQKFSPDMKKLVNTINRVLGGEEALKKAVDEETFRPAA
jgi:hypothetical protein